MAVALRDVENLEAFCEAVIDVYLRPRGGFLRGEVREELAADLVAHSYYVETRFRPEKCSSFSKFLRQRLLWRVTDWYRREFSDQRYHEPVIVESMDAHHPNDERGADDPERSIPVGALTPSSAWLVQDLLDAEIASEQDAWLVLAARGIEPQRATRLLYELRDELVALGLGPGGQRLPE